MKTLSGLKVEALAVPFDERFTSFKLSANGYNAYITPYWENSRSFKTTLPKANYKILGRANELTPTQKRSLISPTITMQWGNWEDYMEANNLTNQLILIKK